MPGHRNVSGPTYNDLDDPSKGEFLATYVCFSPDPATAWGLSHEVWDTKGEFDLWMFIPNEEDKLKSRRLWDRVAEVRVFNLVTLDRLVWIGERRVE